MTATFTIPPVLGLTDLAKRWGRSGEYVRLHLRDTDAFPEPHRDAFVLPVACQDGSKLRAFPNETNAYS